MSSRIRRTTFIEIKELIHASSKQICIGDEHGNRAIHWAIPARRIPIIQTLCNSNAEINAKRTDLQSPLHLGHAGTVPA
ncbi:ankyrin repeat domain-containing protein [Rubripirellula reticaptiva]|uniref:ankyrin repeat domain-containing protein n=1 Tax=Rubripirellula reticaptiva TaxID=2528013 RepID=UPI0011B4C4A7|nr:ankyrin repeat domain-containing protein [Rubripirellula reticaptiva]